MAEPLKRLNYYTGQFLEEPDFKAEQAFHRRVLQMLTYATFAPGVLNGLSVNKIDGSRVVVLKGVAIDALENLAEGDQQSRPIVLTGDITLNLRGGPGGLGFSDGDDVFLYVRYQEEPTDGAVPKNTRFQLREEVLILRDTGAGFTLNTNLNIRLALVRLAAGDLTVVTDTASRQTAALRLSAGPGPGPGATLTTITVTPPNATLTVGSSQTYMATGAFSDGSSRLLTSAGDGLSWSSSNAAVVSIIAATGQAQAVSAGGPVTITATATGISGTAAVQVQPALLPLISTWPTVADRRKHGSEILTVFGSNFAAPMAVLFLAANPANPDVSVPAVVTSATQATVVVPGPLIPTGVNPAVVRSGTIRVTTPGGTSAPSPQAFVLLTT